MSYVLEALKKAERERRHLPDLGMDNLEQDEWVRPPDSKTESQPKKLLWIVAVSICLLVLVVAVKYVVTLEEPQESSESMDSEQMVSQISIREEPQIGAIDDQEIENSESLNTESAPDFSLEELLQEFRFEGSLYVEGNPQSSRVFIDGQAYFVGQTIKNDVYIKDIRLDSVVISDGYEEAIRILR